MNSLIDYSAEVAHIYELEYDTEREDAYASLASRLRKERDAAMTKIAEVESLLKEVGWTEPSAEQKPFNRGYNLAMMQVNRRINGDSGGSQ